MTTVEVPDASAVTGGTPPPTRSWRTTLSSTEVDTRLVGMIVSLAAIWIAFHILSGGAFLTSRNLWNLSVQSTSIAIMATGMVLIIVSRNIDLSVGSLLGMLGYTMALVQTDGIFAFFGISFTAHGLSDEAVRLDHRHRVRSRCSARSWAPRRVSSSPTSACLRSSSPSGASSSGAAPSSGWATSRARRWPRSTTRSGSSAAEQKGNAGRVEELAGRAPRVRGRSCSASCSRAGDGSATTSASRPLWIEVGLAVIGCAAVIVAVGLVANQYDVPGHRQADRASPYPVVILIGVTLLMSYLARRRRFGRYVYAYGGNPEAAELGGINTRRTVMLTFTLMGVLVRRQRGDPDGSVERRGHQPRRAERARRHRRCGHRRHVLRRWHRHDLRRRARRVRHAVVALGHGAAQDRLAVSGHRRRHRARDRGRPSTHCCRQGRRQWAVGALVVGLVSRQR